MNEPQSDKFDALDLRIGQELELILSPSDPNQVFPCELIGCLGQESLIIGPPADSGELPLIEEGQTAWVRTRLADRIAIFNTQILFISEIPTIMVYLDYPTDVKYKQIRSAARVEVSLPVLGYNLDDDEFTAITGKISDISASGACLIMFEKLGSVGHKIELKGKFQFAGIERMIAITAEICKEEPASGDEFVYGVKFCEEDDNKLLVVLGFTFHAMAFGQIQKVR